MKRKAIVVLSLMLALLCTACACKEHTYGDWTVTTPATCTAEGLETRLCTECDEGVETRPVAVLGHSWKEADCVTAKTCSVCSVTEGAPLGHKWADATCTAPKTCSVCQATEGEALGHKWTDATCTAPKTCSVCKATEGEALGHSYGEWIVTQAATCTAAGARQQTCSRCGDVNTEALPLVEHSWQEATCTAPKTCNLCQTTEGEALPHTFEHHICTVCSTLAEDHPLAGKWTLFAIVQNGETALAPLDTIYIDFTGDSRFLFYVQGLETRGAWEYGGEENGVLVYLLTMDVDGSLLYAAISEGYLVVTDEVAAETLVYQKAN